MKTGKRKRRFQMPTAYGILLLLLLAVAVLSHVIDGVTGASLPQLIMSVPEGFLDAVEVCLFILFLGGFLGLVNETGALSRGIASLVKRLSGKELILIPLLMLLFSIGGTTYGMAEETMAFYSLITATMIAAGFDAMTGAALILIGAGAGVLGSTVNPFAISAAVDALQGAYPDIAVNQGIIIGIGLLLWGLALLSGIFVVLRYAAGLKAGRPGILTPAERDASRETYVSADPASDDSGQTTGINKRQTITLWIFGLSFFVMILALIPWESFGVTLFAGTGFLTGKALGSWYFLELQAWFFIASLLVCATAGIGERRCVRAFIDGASDMVGVVFVIAISRGISVLMKSTGLDSYILTSAADYLAGISPAWFAVGAYIIYVGLSFLVPSSSGLAAASMPTFGALAVRLGYSPEVMIMIFTAASGLVNLITPTSAVVMGGLSICRIEWTTWLRFVGKYLIFLMIISVLLLSAAMQLFV